MDVLNKINSSLCNLDVEASLGQYCIIKTSKLCTTVGISLTSYAQNRHVLFQHVRAQQ